MNINFRVSISKYFFFLYFLHINYVLNCLIALMLLFFLVDKHFRRPDTLDSIICIISISSLVAKYQFLGFSEQLFEANFLIKCSWPRILSINALSEVAFPLKMFVQISEMFIPRHTQSFETRFSLNDSLQAILKQTPLYKWFYCNISHFCYTTSFHSPIW